MANTVISNRFITATFDGNTGILVSEYLPETRNMRDSDWKELCEQVKDLTVSVKPRFIIDNNLQRHYEYPPDIQKWTLDLYIPAWNSIGLKKYVQVLPVEIIAKLTAEQIFDLAASEHKISFRIHMTGSMDEAYQWINELNDPLV